jgi:hypothetical protein
VSIQFKTLLSFSSLPVNVERLQLFQQGASSEVKDTIVFRAKVNEKRKISILFCLLVLTARLTGAEEAQLRSRVGADAVQVGVCNFFPEMIDGKVLLVLGDAAEAASRVLANGTVDDHALVGAGATEVSRRHVRSCRQPKK